jgi:hypothetical protein
MCTNVIGILNTLADSAYNFSENLIRYSELLVSFNFILL